MPEESPAAASADVDVSALRARSLTESNLWQMWPLTCSRNSDTCDGQCSRTCKMTKWSRKPRMPTMLSIGSIMASDFTALKFHSFPMLSLISGQLWASSLKRRSRSAFIDHWIRRFCQLLRKDFPVVFSYDIHILKPVGLQRTSGDGSCGMDQSQRLGGKWRSVFSKSLALFASFLKCFLFIFHLFPRFSKVHFSLIVTYSHIFTTCHHCNIMLSSCSPIFWSGLAKCPLFCAGFWAGVGWWIGMQSHLLWMFGLIWIDLDFAGPDWLCNYNFDHLRGNGLALRWFSRDILFRFQQSQVARPMEVEIDWDSLDPKSSFHFLALLAGHLLKNRGFWRRMLTHPQCGMYFCHLISNEC